jgi:hypothetical protein
MIFSSQFVPTNPPPPSSGFASSEIPPLSAARVPSPHPPAGDGSSSAPLVSGALPAGLIAGAIVGALLLVAAGVGAVFLVRRRSHRRASISDSGDGPRDLEFVESTLHETLVTYSDTDTVEGVAPEAIFTFRDDTTGFQSLIWPGGGGCAGVPPAGKNPLTLGDHELRAPSHDSVSSTPHRRAHLPDPTPSRRRDRLQGSPPTHAPQNGVRLAEINGTPESFGRCWSLAPPADGSERGRFVADPGGRVPLGRKRRESRLPKRTLSR